MDIIEISEIKSIKKLELMHKDLVDFINSTEVPRLYIEEYGWGKEDYDYDIELANQYIDVINVRIKELSHGAKLIIPIKKKIASETSGSIQRFEKDDEEFRCI